MNYPNRGIALIFTFDRLSYCPERYFNFGMKDEADRLSKTFKNLEFDIHRYSSLNKSHFEKIIDDYSKRNYSNDDCFLCIIIGHGNENEEVVFDDDRKYNTNNLKAVFSKVATLKDKPKIFLHGCCRGSVLSAEINQDEKICSPLIKENNLKEIHDKASISKASNRITPLADEKETVEQIDGNVLTFYSTTHGYVAVGHSTNPFYILCDLLNLYGLRWTFDDIILEVKDRVANLKYPYKYQEQDRDENTEVEVTVFCESTDNNRKYIRFTEKQNN
jgi:hypothetical protein